MLSQASLKEILHYDPATGLWTWRVARGRASVGSPAGSVRCDGYIKIRVFDEQHYAHRLSFLYMNGYWPIGVDHINGDPSDNSWYNLREATQGENTKNRRLYDTSVSKTHGVTRRGAKWIVQIGGRWIGTFPNIEEAKVARFWAEKLHGYHENHGRTS